MGVNYNSTIITDGLVLCIDAANPRCITSNSNTAFDLSKNYKGCTANVASVYSPVDGGCLSSNGAVYMAGRNSYSSISLPVSSSPRTIMCGFKTPNSIGGSYQHIFHYGSQSTNQSFGMTLFASAGLYYLANHTWAGTSFLSSSAIQTNTKYIGAIKFNDTDSPRNRYFLNGSFGTIGYGQGRSSDYTINTGTGLEYNLFTRIGPAEYFTGNIYFVYVYNRALSDSEILQNYIALRGRYGF